MKRLLLVGWDAADWKVINPLMAEGMMPNVLGLIERGVKGNMATMYPMLSPMLWTTIATGKRPFDHGIHGFAEPEPTGRGVRPITNVSRTSRALWNIATLMGMKSNVVGWWPSHPAEPIDGVMVSDFFQRATAQHGEPWPVRPRAVHPERLTETLAKLRVHPQDLDAGLVNLFLPRLFEMDQAKERRVTHAAKEIAECTTICNVAEALMHFEPWDLTCVYFASIDHFSHGFMNFHPPKMDWVSEKDYELYNQVLRSGYIYHDILLGRLLRQTDQDTTVMLLSDHGFHSDHLRPRDLPDEPAGPAEQHRHYGIFVVAGPNIRKDELVFGATLLNVCPTALTCLDLPVGEDMEGAVLTSIFEDQPEIVYVKSWDEVPGEDGMHGKDTFVDPRDAEEPMRQLVELGYMEALPEDRQQAVDECVRELRYNVARAYMEAMLHVEAVPILEELHERWPNEFRFGILLLNCYLALDRPDAASALIDRVAENKRDDVLRARTEFKAFQEEYKEKLEKARGGDPEALTERERHKLRKLRARSGRNPMALSYLRGVIAAAQHQYEDALKHLARAQKAAPDDLRVLLKLGEVHLSLRQVKKAREVFGRATELDPENAQAWLGRAKTHLAQGRRGAEPAVEAAKKSLGLVYYNPYAHYVLGLACLRQGQVEEAISCLKTAVGQNPNFPEAYRRLASIHEKKLVSPASAKEYKKAAIEARERVAALRKEQRSNRKQEAPVANTPMPANNGVRFPYSKESTVVIVSGLPRSGTSMMMQMLSAGGIEALTDEERVADENNPRGYYELRKATSLARDNSWLGEAVGKSVKVVANFLPTLKPDLSYKIVFMWRDMDEVLRSQETMLKKSGHKGEREQQKLSRTFNAQLRRVIQWMEKAKHLDVLYVSYAEAVADPEAAARQINAFLGGALDEQRMAAAVAPGLYRQKAETPVSREP